MAWFTYRCTKCSETFKLSLDERVSEHKCKHCDGIAKPMLKPSHVKVVEQLDNGLMVRKVERLHDIEEILQERSDKYGGTQDEE